MVKIRNIELPDFPLLLAPMEDVSDPPFRKVCKQNGADLMYTEFISSEGLIRSAAKSTQKLDIFEYERPIGIQIFGGEIESMIQAAEIAEAAGPDLLDINYGCPVKKVTCKEAGAGILRNIPKMIEMTRKIVERVRIPVTVKTRLGWDEGSIHIEEVAERLQDVGIEALSIHGRTRVQMYKGAADWTRIGAVKDNSRIRIPIFGNGDVDSPQKALEMKERYGVDGVMIGRASIGYPWIFRDVRQFLETGVLPDPPSVEERIAVCEEHLRLSLAWKGPVLGILETRRHYANYFRNFPGIKEYRTALCTAESEDRILHILKNIQAEYAGYVPQSTYEECNLAAV